MQNRGGDARHDGGTCRRGLKFSDGPRGRQRAIGRNDFGGYSKKRMGGGKAGATLFHEATLVEALTA
jgi:hypothetical protein